MNKRLSTLTTLIVLLILFGSTMETHAKVVGYWSFNNQEHIGEDSSPNHNHGELKGRDTAKWVRGKAGGALQLDGGSWLEVPHNESLNLKDQLTLMCWVKFANHNDFGWRGRSQALIWKPTRDVLKPISYSLDVHRDQLELDLPLYSNNSFRLYVIDPKCRGQFINGIPDFPASCQRRFIYDRIGSKYGGLRFRAYTPDPNRATVYAVHPTFFVNFFPIDSPRLDEDDKEFIKKKEQDFVQAVSDFMIGTSNIYLPRIVRPFENLDEIWFHFAAVADGKRIRLYVNGREKVSKRHRLHWQHKPFINSQESLMIGRSFNPVIRGLGAYLNGVIDEVMILDHALTEDEIKEAMELGKTGISLDRFLVDSQGVSVVLDSPQIYVAPGSPQIYWTDAITGKIQRANLNGTNMEDLVTGLSRPESIALDVVNGKMYWVNMNKIWRANLDGTNIEDVVERNVLVPRGITLDVIAGKMYWTDIGRIWRANLDGTNMEDLVDKWPFDITLDVAGGKMYWTDIVRIQPANFVGKIQRANLDGTNIEDLVVSIEDLVVMDGLGLESIALDIVGGKIYWANAVKIQRANLDGTNIEDLVVMDGLQSKSIALDVVNGKMYWANTNMGKIQRANLDGTHVEDVVTGLRRPTGIALALSSAPSFVMSNIDTPQPTVDVNGDGLVNTLDLVLVATNVGKTGQNPADVNGDGIVNILDLIKVAGEIGADAAAPSVHQQTLEILTAADIRDWLLQAQHANLTDAVSQRGILILEQLLATLIPKETSLLPNYPNPFNPETWIPYQLSEPAEVTLTIYTVNGTKIRTLALGLMPAGIYQSRSRAIHWDGRNAVGEPVTSGVYFYTFTAGEFSDTRKMLIMK